MNRYQKQLLGAIALLIGIFFFYKGLSKHWLSPCKTYGPDSTLPVDYMALISVLCRNNYFKMVGALQMLGGILLVIPKTRLIGSAVLLPVVLVIFTLHLFIDNRPDELLETGLPLLGLVFILADQVSRKIGWKSLF